MGDGQKGTSHLVHLYDRMLFNILMSLLNTPCALHVKNDRASYLRCV